MSTAIFPTPVPIEVVGAALRVRRVRKPGLPQPDVAPPDTQPLQGRPAPGFRTRPRRSGRKVVEELRAAKRLTALAEVPLGAA